MSTLRMLLVIVSVAWLAACGSDVAVGGSSPHDQDDYAGEWRLISGSAPSGEIPVPRDVTLTIDKAKLSGTSACNHYFGTVRIDKTTFDATEVGGTAMGCPGKRMVAEQRYLEALQAANSITRDGERLDITGPKVALEFEPVVPPEPAPFEDTKWRMDSLYYGRGPEGSVSSTEAPGTIRFSADGRLKVATGCRTIGGRWQRSGDVVTVTGLPEGTVDCQTAGGQDDHVMAVLSEPFTAEVVEQTLTLQQVDGELGLGYRAD